MLILKRKLSVNHWRFQRLHVFRDYAYRFFHIWGTTRRAHIKYTLTGHKTTRMRALFTANFYCVNTYLKSYCAGVVSGFTFDRAYSKELAFVKTPYNTFSIVESLPLFFPGLILTINKHYQELLSRTYLVTHPVMLSQIPSYTSIFKLNNKINTKVTFSKSWGSVSIKQHQARKARLVGVILPSQEEYFFSSQTYCFVYALNLKPTLKPFLGSWGATTRFKKKITVRGVAKNPVDHPNGGRTKAKQPERSPWGWIAKLRK